MSCSVNKRLLKEISYLQRQQSQKPLLENDYLIHYDDSDINLIYAIIKPPEDSVYRHKFIRLNIRIPQDYPHSPPEVFFVNFDSVRIHPNMYETGKCCSTILNTWGDSIFEKWTSSMNIESILITFHSFLDNNPYTYEPGNRDDPSYTVYVLYQSWFTCLIRYLENYNEIPLFKKFIETYLLKNVDYVFGDLDKLLTEYPYGTYYTRCFEIDHYIINYQRIIMRLSVLYDFFEKEESYDKEYAIAKNKKQKYNIGDYDCEICYDSGSISKWESTIKLFCNHSFHNTCLLTHIETNHSLCPMCRREISDSELDKIKVKWIKNPVTKRKIKVGGPTYNHLVDLGIINETGNIEYSDNSEMESDITSNFSSSPNENSLILYNNNNNNNTNNNNNSLYSNDDAFLEIDLSDVGSDNITTSNLTTRFAGIFNTNFFYNRLINNTDENLDADSESEISDDEFITF